MANWSYGEGEGSLPLSPSGSSVTISASIAPTPAVSTAICARDQELLKLGRFFARMTGNPLSDERAKSSARVVFRAAAIFPRDAIDGET